MSPSPKRAPTRVLALALALVAVSAAAGFGVVAYTRSQRHAPPAPLEIYGALPPLSFTDQTGATITDADLRGHVVIANFIFTRCPTVCPVFSMKMQRVARETADLAEPPMLVSLSVDPEYDSPAVLAEYGAKYDADPARWKFLTGDPTAIKETVEGAFKIAMDERGELDGGVPNIIHGTHFVLLDRELRIRGYYDSEDIDRIRALINDARRLTAG